MRTSMKVCSDEPPLPRLIGGSSFSAVAIPVGNQLSRAEAAPPSLHLTTPLKKRPASPEAWFWDGTCDDMCMSALDDDSRSK